MSWLMAFEWFKITGGRLASIEFYKKKYLIFKKYYFYFKNIFKNSIFLFTFFKKIRISFGKQNKIYDH